MADTDPGFTEERAIRDAASWPEDMAMGDWSELAELCRKALNAMPEEKRDHEIAMALRTTGAFAESVVAHWSES